MNPAELERALGRLVDMAESATARLDRLAVEVSEIRSIVEGLRFRAASAGRAALGFSEDSVPAAATGNPTPGGRAPQAEVIFK